MLTETKSMVPPEVMEALFAGQWHSLVHHLHAAIPRGYFQQLANRMCANFAAQKPPLNKEQFFVRLTQSMGATTIFWTFERLYPNSQQQCDIAERLSKWPLPQTKEQFFELLLFTMAIPS